MTGKEVIKILEKDGWEIRRISGSHHIMAKRNLIVSVPVHGSRDIPKGTVHKILKEAGIK